MLQNDIARMWNIICLIILHQMLSNISFAIVIVDDNVFKGNLINIVWNGKCKYRSYVISMLVRAQYLIYLIFFNNLILITFSTFIFQCFRYTYLKMYIKNVSLLYIFYLIWTCRYSWIENRSRYKKNLYFPLFITKLF